MIVLPMDGARIEGLCACLPSCTVTNDEKVAKATGIVTRRVAPSGTTVVDLCAKAAVRVLADTASSPGDFGAIVFVSFTQNCRMPCGAAQVQTRLGFPKDVIAFDVSLACSGWGYGLYLAALLAKQTGRKTLLLDGDMQSAFTDAANANVAPLLADGGTATVVGTAADGDPWSFAFRVDGEKGQALKLEHGGHIEMDGFGVFRFVATDVVCFLKDFLAAHRSVPPVFVPHQPNVYMVRQLARNVGFSEERTVLSCDVLGNLSSASVPASIAWRNVRGRLLTAGFGGGLSIFAGVVTIPVDTPLSVVEY